METKLWITKRPNGLYILSEKPPQADTITTPGGREVTDWWPVVGDKVSLPHLCPYIVYLLGEDAGELQVGTPRQITMSIRLEDGF